MSQWKQIRSLARQRRTEVRAIAGADAATALLAAAEQLTGLSVGRCTLVILCSMAGKRCSILRRR